MSGTPANNDWYIARDGVQHGPVSDVEMRKFVELGHLRPTDLVWCARFTNWQPGAQAFPELGQPKPLAAPMVAQSQPAPQSSPQPAPQSAARVQPSPAVVPNPTQPRAQPQPAAARPAAPQPSQPKPREAAPVAEKPETDAAWAEAMRAIVEGSARPTTAAAPAVQPGQARAAANNPGSHPTSHPARPAGQTPMAAPAPNDARWSTPMPTAAPMAAAGPSVAAAVAPTAMPVAEPAPFAVPKAPAYGAGAPMQDFADEIDDAPPARPRRSWIGVATAALAVILIVGGLGWFSWQNRALVTGAGASAISAVVSKARPNVPSADHYRAPPYQITGETREQIDASMQRAAVWRYLKREFADWYNEIVGELERRRAQKHDERAITQFLVDVIVTLRRRNAQAALQASPDHLRAMAGAFVANLKQLGSRDGATCFAFVSHGESSPFMIELSRTPAFAETLQKQMISVFEAVVDARTARKVHPTTRRTDYDRLTADLIARGWSQGDLATFSDPQKLSTTLPDKVCSLVQEWFTTQLALKEPDLQVRLLAESLKPLVGG